MICRLFNSNLLAERMVTPISKSTGYRWICDAIRYDTIRQINVRSKADEMASLI